MAHFLQLDALRYGPGCDPDHIARVMLTRGYPNERARTAILLKATGGDPDAGYPLTRRAVAQLVMATGGIEAVVPGVANAWQQVGWVAAVVDRLASMTVMGGRTDSAGALIGPLEETPDQRRHAIATMFASASVGEEPEDTTPLSDIEALYDGNVRRDERGATCPPTSSPRKKSGECPAWQNWPQWPSGCPSNSPRPHSQTWLTRRPRHVQQLGHGACLAGKAMILKP